VIQNHQKLWISVRIELFPIRIYLSRNQKEDKFIYHFTYWNNSCCIKRTNVLVLQGESIRTRTILKHPRHGGSACPNLREIWKCARKISFFHIKFQRPESEIGWVLRCTIAANFARGSGPLLNIKCTLVHRKEGTVSNYGGFGVYSMNKKGEGGKNV
jgi:hypothetical protein